MNASQFIARIVGVVVTIVATTEILSCSAIADVPSVTVFKSGQDGYHTFRIPAIVRAKNGELLALAEDHYDVLVTIDKNIRYQQNMTDRHIAILIIRAPSNDISDIEPRIPEALVALQSIQPGEVVEIGTP